ncbi:hypothetical protein D5086_015389 [Populus alba]|uniref:Uncharacterized protein n=1 Tax=Populus alba TaxID=43335 RepID=A0ACC4C310_POPAL
MVKNCVKMGNLGLGSNAVNREDYEGAVRLKVAIAAVATNDTVGRVMSLLNRALEQEHRLEAAFLRDNTGACCCI